MFTRRNAVLLNLFKRHISSQNNSWQEVRIPVPWGSVAGKWWGPQDQRPVLCLHGWQDNCGTFDRLIPLLKNDVAYLAIDFPGHGYSDRIPPGMFYHHTVYYLCVHYLVRYFKWDSVHLMGHSLGGVAALTYSTFCPNRVDSLVCLDLSVPMAIAQQDTLDVENEMRRFMKCDSLQESEDEPPCYTFEEIKQRVAQSQNNSIKIEYSPYVALRNIKESTKSPGKFYFSRDLCLKAATSLNWEQKQFAEKAQDLKFPMLMMKALSGSGSELKENFYEVMDSVAKINKDLHVCKLKGTHHLHLNNPEELSKAMNEFLDRYHKVDKSKGGLRNDIIHNEKENKISAVC